MSIMNDVTVTCPSCEEQITVTLAESVNADRRPDLRDQIIEGTFQAITCGECGAEFMLDPVMNYLDMGRNQWFSVQPADRLGDWTDVEDEATEIFDLAYGNKASAQAREIGDTLNARLVFGWASLREKLLIGDLQLDDTIIELCKLAMIHGLPGAPIQAGVDLRLVNAEEDGSLVFDWADVFSGEVLETLVAPRSLYDGIIDAPEAWADMKAALSAGLFVDIQKLFVGEGRAAG